MKKKKNILIRCLLDLNKLKLETNNLFLELVYKKILSIGDIPITIDLNSHKLTLIIGTNGYRVLFNSYVDVMIQNLIKIKLKHYIKAQNTDDI